MQKLAWHEHNLDFLKRTACGRDCKLRGSYLEVVDDMAPESYGLMVGGPNACLTPAGFVAVNHRPNALIGHPRDKPYHLFADDAFDLSVRLSRMSRERLVEWGLPAPVVAFNFDLQCNADSMGDFWPGHWEQLHEAVTNTYAATGLCVIILNMALHHRFLHERAMRPSEAVALHAAKVCETFAKVPVKGLTLAALLGNTPGVLNDGGLDLHGRESGAFQMYRKTTVPMVTLRVAFSEGRAVCGFDSPSVAAA